MLVATTALAFALGAQIGVDTLPNLKLRGIISYDGRVCFGLLADRDLTDGGVEVSFFGEPARMAVGPAALALQTHAALHPVSIHNERRAGGGWGIVVTWHDEVPVPDGVTRGAAGTRAAVTAMTQACADVLAGAIAEHPQDWHMLQRVFSADLGGGAR